VSDQADATVTTTAPATRPVVPRLPGPDTVSHRRREQATLLWRRAEPSARHPPPQRPTFSIARGREPHHTTANMGICMSTNNDDVEQKKRSQAIDRKLEEDSRRLRRECKILLLGEWLTAAYMSRRRPC